MRIDVVSIFPDYLAPLQLSLLGKARLTGLVDIHVHDLRTWTHDRHRTVDDTPYGGGAGMVMRPEPWGEALDEVLTHQSGSSGRPPRLLVTTPSGHRFDQRTADRLAGEDRLIIACGRYEGIDQRVVDHYSSRLPVEEISIGDVVLSGGEVAAMVIIEGVARLVPGVLGNPSSLTEESHRVGPGQGLLEYPVYTRPARWRGLDVPAVLRSGDHAQVERWRAEVARRRTAERRPDLLHPSATVSVGREGLERLEVRRAEPGDAAELLTLQRACWAGATPRDDARLASPLAESLDDVRAGIGAWTTWVVRSHGRLVASVRGGLVGTDWQIGRAMVAPDLQGRGVGRWLVEMAEGAAPDEAERCTVVACDPSKDGLRCLRRAGYRPTTEPASASAEVESTGAVRLAKPCRREG